MSIGAPSNLGTLLIQRLDAMLGTTLSQQVNVISGASPQAITQPGSPESATPSPNATQRQTEDAVEQASGHGGRQTAVDKATREIELSNLLGRGTTSQRATQSAPTTLGYAARIILALFNEYPASDKNIRPQAPLLPQPPPGGAPVAAELARALAQSVRTSGLFYESHLAQLATGRLNAHSLRLEPQGTLLAQTAPDLQPQSAPQAQTSPGAQTQWALHTPAIPDAQTQAASHGPTAAAAPPSGASHPAAGGVQPPVAPHVPDTQPLADKVAHAGPSSGTASEALPAPAKGHDAIPGIDPRTQFLVRQQLEVLASQSFAWQGDIWSGASLRCEIRREPPAPGSSGTHGSDPDTHWSTRLVVDLPVLGTVQARINLNAEQIVLHMVAPDSASQLVDGLDQLRARLQATGLQPGQLTVAEQDDTRVAPPRTPNNEIPTV